MALGGQGSKMSKNAINILNELPSNYAERFKWKFLFEKRKDQLEKYLTEKISLSENSEGQYIATYSPIIDGRAELVKIFQKLSLSLLAVQKLCHGYDVRKYSSNDMIQFYVCEVGDQYWIVGEKDLVNRVIFEVDEFNNGALSGVVKAEHELDKKNVDELFDIHLSQKEQAILYLHKMWNINMNKRGVINIEQGKYYSARVQVKCNKGEEKDAVENEFRLQLKAKQLDMSSTKVSFDSNKIKFLLSEPVYNYVDKELNRSEMHPKCAWYIDEKTLTVDAYTISQFDLKSSKEIMEKALISNSIPVPCKYFATAEAKSSMKVLESKCEGKLKLCLSSSCQSLHLICTKDKVSYVDREVKNLFVTKTLGIYEKGKHQLCKKLFKLKQTELEKQYNINVLEEENVQSGKYGFIIKGKQSSVQCVHDKLKSCVESISQRQKDYKADFNYETAKLEIIPLVCNKPIEVTVEKVSMHTCKTLQLTDLQDEKLCHFWNLPNGNNIQVINSDETWIEKDSILMQIEICEKNPPKLFEFKKDKSIVSLYLPPWKKSVDNEKDVLRSVLNMMCQEKVLDGKKAVLILNEPVKNGWPWKKFLKEVLAAFGRNYVELTFLILDPSRQLFEKASEIAQNYASSVCNQRIQIKVKTGNLAQEQVDAIVNSSNEDLDLSTGAVSRSILHAAGDSIQKQCKEILEKGRRISSKEVVVTNGFNLKCTYVFHGVLAPWHRQTLADFVLECLQQAESRHLSSIAFPSLGTGNLNYPADKVAKTMFQTVLKYAGTTNISFLKEVNFVIFEKDLHALQAFKDEQKRLNEATRMVKKLQKSSNPFYFRITVQAESQQQCEEIFFRIDEVLKRKHYQKSLNLIEPKEQEMERSVIRNSDQYKFEDDTDKSQFQRHPSAQETESKMEQHHQYASVRDEKNEQESTIDEEIAVCIQILGDDNDNCNHYRNLVLMLQKYNVPESQVIWCPYTPKEARVKVPLKSNAEYLINAMQNEKNYKASKCNAEAVVNIRGKLNSSISSILIKNEDSVQKLKRQSGVGVSMDKDGSIVLTGSLYEINSARDILTNWNLKNNADIIKDTKKAAFDEKENCGNDELMEHVGSQINQNKDVVESSNTETRKVISEDGNLRISVGNNHSHTSKPENRPQDMQNAGAFGSEFVGSMNTENQPYCESNCNPIGYEKIPKFPTVGEDSLMLETQEGIKVYVYQGDICFLHVDGIVNSSNERMIHTRGLSAIIAKEAGDAVNNACQQFLTQHESFKGSQVCFTTAGNLKHYKGIIHVCSPLWHERKSKDDFYKGLSYVINNALYHANGKKMKSIAIPAVGSGDRGGLKQLCYSAYANGIKMFSKQVGRSSSLKEVHFVDICLDVTNFIRTAFLLSIEKPDSKLKTKLNMMPKDVKETFTSYIEVDDTIDKKCINMHFENNVEAVICDGALFTCYKHRHNIDLMTSKNIFQYSAVVITEDKSFSGKSRSAVHCLQRGGEEFQRYYERVKESKEKKKPGKVYNSSGDKCLNYNQVFYPVLPTLHLDTLKDSTKWFSRASDCFKATLLLADDMKIKHLCMPVLAEDFQTNLPELFLKKCVEDTMTELCKFAAKRDKKTQLLIHIAGNANVIKLFNNIREQSNCFK